MELTLKSECFCVDLMYTLCAGFKGEAGHKGRKSA